MEQKGLDFGAAAAGKANRRPALTVSALTDRLQGVLETEFFDVWVEGEISNLTTPASGHWYFSLKDERSQVRAVLWKTAARLVKWKPRDGMRVLVRGGIKVYAPRGDYQIQVEVVEPLGKGSLQQAFEELKERLEKEGLFAAARKRPLPMLPRCIGIVTSPTGAVIQDILRVLSRRYANLGVLIYPARVQGPEASGEIQQGIKALNRFKSVDVVMVARGGGSLEDLWPFNEEQVARALASSRIPTMSAVGHETDFTIADFVADVRAPTPSAGAERVVQAKEEMAARIEGLERRLTAAMGMRMTRTRARVQAMTSHRVFTAEQGRVRTYAQRVDELGRRAERGLLRTRELAAQRLRRATERLEAYRWDRQAAARRERIDAHTRRLHELVRARVRHERTDLARVAGKLDSLSPLAVLSRGYALAFDERGHLVQHASQVAPGDAIDVRLADGRVRATVTETRKAEE
ncbi:MAG: exodeoxyribonuclease VII large subunit [Vicinamibacteria bacterium]